MAMPPDVGCAVEKLLVICVAEKMYKLRGVPNLINGILFLKSNKLEYIFSNGKLKG
jgi:hypothetical protein